jgi:hypothetical protein
MEMEEGGGEGDMHRGIEVRVVIVRESTVDQEDNVVTIIIIIIIADHEMGADIHLESDRGVEVIAMTADNIITIQ